MQIIKFVPQASKTIDEYSLFVVRVEKYYRYVSLLYISSYSFILVNNMKHN